MNIILYAIPVFLLLIAIELFAEKLRGTHYYRLNDALTSLSIGTLSRVIGVLKAMVPLTIYALLYEHASLWEVPETLLAWIVIFVAYDFLYYWNHRFGHEISLFWAAHVVHHSSEDYNLTTALRQTSGSFFNFVFFIPLAVLGVDPLMLITVASVNLVYQFWVHTQHITKLGWFEWFFVTPSNHRVHHAQNQIYLDKNYGGVFIIWDRFFGTFQEELDEEPPIYGVRKALKSWNPLMANIQVYRQLALDSLRTKSWRHKLKVWLGKTGWRPTDVEQKYPLARTDLASFSRFDTTLNGYQKAYSVVQYAFNATLAVFLLINIDSLALSEQLLLATFVTISSISLSIFMQNSVWGIYCELTKLLLVFVLLTLVPLTNSYSTMAVGAFLLLSSMLLTTSWMSLETKSNSLPNT